MVILYKHQNILKQYFIILFIVIFAVYPSRAAVQTPSTNDSLNSNFQANSNYDSLIKTYSTIVDSFVLISRYDSAYIYYNKYIDIKDSIYDINRLKTIDNLIEKHKMTERKSQAKILEQKLRNSTLILVFSIFLILLIVILLILTYSRYKIKKKVYEEETIALNMTIDEKNKELISRAKEQNHQNEIFQDIKSNIDSINRASDLKALKKYLTNLKKDIEQKEKIEFVWDNFKEHFEQVHPVFFEKLLQYGSSLTQNDLRICAYIKLNLSTKDTANILNISNRAIQTSRYRIKKKLNLSQEVDLIKFIQTI